MTYWTDFGYTQAPPMSARTKITPIEMLKPIVDQRFDLLAAPLVGITTDGSPVPDLFELRSTGLSLEPLADAANAFLATLSTDQQAAARQPMESDVWRCWINVHMNYFRNGVMLEDLGSEGRGAAMNLLRETLSARGFAQARDIMRINQLIGDLTERPDEFGEWIYFVTVFGEPGGEAPWGWQLDGHHININCVVVGDQLVMTPMFMGCEPRSVHEGPMAGTQLFWAEETSGLNLIRSFDAGQRDRAILRPSIHRDDLPGDLRHPFDGRMQAGAFNDNAVLPYVGVPGADMSDAQRRLLLNVASNYAGWLPDGHSELRMAEIVRHLDETWFSWLGGTDDVEPFYYRLHSPVAIIEFDHHPGVAFDNRSPTRNHVHTVIRTPNGGDYGADLLRQHHERFDHSTGAHIPQ